MIVLAAGLTACGQESTSNVPLIEEKAFALTPATASVNASFLRGQIEGLKVTERVEQGTGKVVDPPKLRAVLKLKNSSSDRTVRLVSGRVNYVDANGKLIRLAEGRTDTSFKFSNYTTERLDPGMEMSQDLEVPFPAVALKDQAPLDIRLELSYIPSPYSEETVTIRVSPAK